MLWQQTLIAWMYVMRLNAWLANYRPELQPELDWRPVIVDQHGEVIQ